MIQYDMVTILKHKYVCVYSMSQYYIYIYIYLSLSIYIYIYIYIYTHIHRRDAAEGGSELFGLPPS